MLPLECVFCKARDRKNVLKSKTGHTTWLKTNFQLSLERESPASLIQGQVYQGETSSSGGLECLESGWTGSLLKDISRNTSVRLYGCFVPSSNNIKCRKRTSYLEVNVL